MQDFLSESLAFIYLRRFLKKKKLLVFLHLDIKRIYSFPQGDGAIAVYFGGENIVYLPIAGDKTEL